jgi:hypothetical protein
MNKAIYLTCRILHPVCTVKKFQKWTFKPNGRNATLECVIPSFAFPLRLTALALGDSYEVQASALFGFHGSDSAFAGRSDGERPFIH